MHAKTRYASPGAAQAAVVRAYSCCLECAERFEVSPDQARNVKAWPLYCSPPCRIAYTQRRKLTRRYGGCTVCSGPVERVRHGYPLCVKDDNLLWKSCLGKWASLSETEVLDTHKDKPTEFVAYPCPICLRWHRATAGRGADAARQERQELIGERLRAAGFPMSDRIWIGVSTRG